MDDLCLDASHPPIFLRIELLKKKYIEKPVYEFPKQDSQKIENELRHLYDEIHDILVNNYKYSIS